MPKLFKSLQEIQNFRVTALGVIIAVMLIFSMNRMTEEALRNNNTRYLVVLAKVAAIQFDPVKLREISQTKDPASEANLKIEEELHSIMRQNPDIFSISIFVPSAEPNTFEYLANAHLFDRDLNNDKMISPEEEPIPLGRKQVFSGDSPIYKSLGVPATEDRIYPDSWGVTRSVFAPIFDYEGKPFATLKIDVSQKSYLHDINATRSYFLVILAGMIGLVLLLSYILKRSEKVSRHQQQLNEIKDEFISIASHELRTPMSVVQGYLDFFLDGKYGMVPTEQRLILTKILKNTDQLLSLINNLLDINQMELGRMKFKKETFEMSGLVEEASQDFDIITFRKKLRLVLTFPKNITTTVRADREKVHRVLTNLIGNACKFTPQGGEIEVALQIASEPNFLQVSVRDNGPGIPPEQHHLMFEKFHQVENKMQKNFEGSGLGLSIVKAMVTGMGGKIWLQSSPGSGSTFFFLLPQSDGARLKKDTNR